MKIKLKQGIDFTVSSSGVITFTSPPPPKGSVIKTTFQFCLSQVQAEMEIEFIQGAQWVLRRSLKACIQLVAGWRNPYSGTLR